MVRGEWRRKESNGEQGAERGEGRRAGGSREERGGECYAPC
jgi:hypothetical protein